MKKSNLFIGMLVAVYVLTGILFLFYTKESHKEKMALLQTVQRQEDALYSQMFTLLESEVVRQHVSPSESLLVKGSFVLVFPGDFCDACNLWLYRQLEKLGGKLPIAAIAPKGLETSLMKSSDIYHLHLSSVKGSNSLLFPDTHENAYAHLAYIFYYSKDGQVRYPLLLSDKTIDLKAYLEAVSMLCGDFE